MINQEITDAHNDPMGAAITDYFKTGKASTLKVLSSMFEDDEIPVSELFRTYDAMPAIEQKALQMAKGRTLDVGAGAGCHALALQEMQKDADGIEVSKDVVAIDISPLSVEVMKARGVKDARLQDFFADDFQEKFDTILMLMNGTGIIGKLDNIGKFFAKAKQLLNEGGQILVDSSDLNYIFEDEDGFFDTTEFDNYYGEIDFRMQYKNIKGSEFYWLYLDSDTLQEQAAKHGFNAEIIAEGDHCNYLARLTANIQ